MATLLIVTSLPLIIMFILSGYWESVLFIGIGLVFSISILMAILKTATDTPSGESRGTAAGQGKIQPV